MATISKVAMLIAGAHFVALASPSAAFAQTPQGPPAPTTQEPPAAPLRARFPIATATGDPSVVVHLEGSEVAELQQDSVGDHRHWVTVCSAPCDKAVPSQFSYRIEGEGIRRSKVFTLRPQSGDRETITVDESSKSAFVGAIVGTSVAGLVIVIGLFVVLVGAAENAADTFRSSTNQHDNTETIGGAMSVAGLVGVIVGAIGIGRSAHSGVTQGSVSSPEAWLSPSWLSPSGWASAPGSNGTFKDARREAAWTAALPPAAVAPLFSAHF